VAASTAAAVTALQMLDFRTHWMIAKRIVVFELTGSAGGSVQV